MNIYVGNVSYGVNDRDLENLFSEFGEVSSARIIIDRETGRSKGFGFVEMPNKDDALEAIKSLNGKEIEGRNLRVNEARAREDNFRRRARY
ncbi:MAG: RNA-binding protein [Candidatus Cloacimonas sp. 4484_275]|nr:MAG: RNA-binding protein [Candidatus Cloacimonas sp. 4484_275]RLC53079.1 MAG: RNA-binding protein [Candidatus Cloacimonadota bacterium]